MHVPPGSIHLHKHSPSVASPPSLGLGNRPDQNSQSSVAGAGLSLGENHFPTNSLTWRELLTGLTTCLFNHNHLSHLERVLHTGLTTCFFNSIPAQGGQQQRFNTHSHRDDNNINRWAWHRRRQQPTLKHDTTKAITQVSGSSGDTERLTDELHGHNNPQLRHHTTQTNTGYSGLPRRHGSVRRFSHGFQGA
jgi:hypothetical protein